MGPALTLARITSIPGLLKHPTTKGSAAINCAVTHPSALGGRSLPGPARLLSRPYRVYYALLSFSVRADIVVSIFACLTPRPKLAPSV